MEPTIVVVVVWLIVVWLVIWLLPKVVAVDVFVGLDPTVVSVWLAGLLVVVWPGLCVVVVVDTNGLFGIIEIIVSVELVGVGVVEFIGVSMLVPTGGWEGSFLGTHLPALQKYVD